MIPTSSKYDDPNLPLTNEFENTFRAHRVGANFRVQNKKYNYQLGVGMQQINYLRIEVTRLCWIRILLTTSQAIQIFSRQRILTIRPSRSKNLRFSYNGRTNQPTISQLQNVAGCNRYI